MIFFLFKPLDIKEKIFKDVPMFEFQNFTMYELNTQGLKTQMLGSRASKYSDRYQIKDINYTDYSKKYRANMLAKNGIYKANMIYLDTNVTYKSLKKNNFTFTTQHAIYNKKTARVKVKDKYTITFNGGVIHGTSLEYDAIKNKVFSKHVEAVYILK